jgi:acid phosphatase type 7
VSSTARRVALGGACAAAIALGGWLVTNGEGDSDPTVIRTPTTGAPVLHTRKRAAEIWAVGDGNAGEDAAALARRIGRAGPDLFLYLGDVYPSGRPDDFARNYASTYGRLAGRTAPTPGNHDWPEASEGYYPYWHAATAKPIPSFYALRLAGWDILSLNSEAPHGVGSAQLRWLHRRVQHAGNCRLAFWHRPRFSAGTVHGDQPDVSPLWEALHGRARLILNGHEHDSQVFRPRDGITELVAGAGGNGLYPVDESDPRLAFGDATHFAALRIRLHPRIARFAFVTAGGHILDSGSARCRAARL